MFSSECIFCAQAGGEVLWSDARVRIVWPGEPDYPTLCRVVWQSHVKEMTDLNSAQRAHFMTAVFELEQALRVLTLPDKINLASLGNVVPHLHWHVVPRHGDDPHYPGSIWSERQRPASRRAPDGFSVLLRSRLAARLASSGA